MRVGTTMCVMMQRNAVPRHSSKCSHSTHPPQWSEFCPHHAAIVLHAAHDDIVSNALYLVCPARVGLMCALCTHMHRLRVSVKNVLLLPFRGRMHVPIHDCLGMDVDAMGAIASIRVQPQCAHCATRKHDTHTMPHVARARWHTTHHRSSLWPTSTITTLCTTTHRARGSRCMQRPC
jgi:hypothetical protein